MNHAGLTYSPMARTPSSPPWRASMGRACALRVQIVKAAASGQSAWGADEPVGLGGQPAPPARLRVPARITVRPAHAESDRHSCGAWGHCTPTIRATFVMPHSFGVMRRPEEDRVRVGTFPLCHPLGPRTVKHHGNAELVDIGLARRFLGIELVTATAALARRCLQATHEQARAD